jgi:hypothetical protein
MAAETSTFADGSRRTSHHNSNGAEHCLNIVLADRTLSSEGPAGTEEPAPAVRADGEETPTAMAENVAATVPVPPATTPMSNLAAPTPMSKCEIEFRNLMAFRGLPNTKEKSVQSGAGRLAEECRVDGEASGKEREGNPQHQERDISGGGVLQCVPRLASHSRSAIQSVTVEQWRLYVSIICVRHRYSCHWSCAKEQDY